MSHPTLVMSPALYCGAVEEENKGLGVEAVPNAKEMPKKCQKPKNNITYVSAGCMMFQLITCHLGSNLSVYPQKSFRNEYLAFPAGASAMRSAHPMGCAHLASISFLASASCSIALRN